jgi:predicted TIM-barrel fold metal-dependent hydrolase
MAEPFDLIDLLKYPTVRITIGHVGYLWMCRVGYMWNVYSAKKKRSVAVLVISTTDINEAIAAFVKEAGIRKEDSYG